MEFNLLTKNLINNIIDNRFQIKIDFCSSRFRFEPYWDPF